MRRLSLAALAVLAACSSSSDSARSPRPAQPVDIIGLTTFLQCVPMTEPYLSGDDYEMFPGCANVWDLDRNFGLDDGGNDQWDGALGLAVGDLTTQPPTRDSVRSEVGSLGSFPYTATPVTWLSPLVSAAALDQAVVVTDGARRLDYRALTGRSAFLSPGLGTALRQALDLRAAQAPVTLTLSDRVELGFDNFGLTVNLYRIVVEDAQGEELEELLFQDASSMPQARSFDLSAYAGQRVRLAFEFASSPDDWTTVAAVVDDVSVVDDAEREHVVNGGFEDGLTGWSTTREDQPYGVVSSTEPVGGLDVTRSFYTRPGLAWARWVDELVNPTDAEISTQVVYTSNLGSDWAGIIYPTPGVTGALTTWDGSDPDHGADRDVALVFGSGKAFYESATWMTFACPVGQTSCGDDGDDDIYFVYDVTVPAGGRVSLVHFIVQGGGNTAVGATAPDARATAVDKAAAAIAKGFGSNAAFRDHMTAEQLETIANF